MKKKIDEHVNRKEQATENLSIYKEGPCFRILIHLLKYSVTFVFCERLHA